MSARARVRHRASWETRLLLLVTVFLVVFGLAAVYGASSIVALQQGAPGSYYALRQLIGATIGSAALILGARYDYHTWQRYAWPILGVVALALLILLLPFADPIVVELNGARRWLGVPGLSFQPAEVAKFAVVAWTAMLATKKGEGVRDLRQGILPFVVILAPVAALILFEPALSVALSVCLLAAIILFAAGARIGHFMIVGIVMIPFVWRQITTVQYRMQRWLTFLSSGTDYAGSSWQIQQSLIGMGAGRYFGVGFGQGMQKMGYLPYGYSDFIFSTIGEEWGFVGVAFMIALYAAFIGIGLRIARTAGDRFGSLLATGITALIGVTAFVHIAVTLGVVPTTGLPLPFVSYGRSNLIVSMFATGVLINIGEHRSQPTKRR
ncbi:MAG: putative peptidoglycan glycosyltransferase FtsW [Gemmatimonadetes bacterium]|nr:putative peptidoglycan glycosyltransferase FtsW [Gemmatimonadota bacterium]